MGIEYLYLVGLALMGGGCTFFRKKYTQVTSGSSLTGSLFYIMAVGVISLFSYWGMAGGTIHTDSRTMIYAIASSFVLSVRVGHGLVIMAKKLRKEEKSFVYS